MEILKNGFLVRPLVFWFSLVLGVVLIFEKIFWASIFIIISPFYLFPLEILLNVAFFVVLGWALIYAVLKFKTDRHKAYIPLAINIIIGFFIYLFPIQNLVVNVDFYSKLEDREKFVSMVKSHELINMKNGFVKLPQKEKHLSKGGDIIVEEKNDTIKIFFYTFRGILDSYSGFIYCSDDTEPSKNTFGGDITQIKKMKDHWFWVVFR